MRTANMLKESEEDVMKIIGLLTSPRKNSETKVLMDAVLKGLKIMVQLLKSYNYQSIRNNFV